jgi:putative ABC transport system permease protein
MDLSTTFKDISNNIIDGISIILIVFSIITLIVSGILIGILTYINIMEYKHEIGIYKSLGISNNSIKSIFFLENIMIIIRSFYIASIFIEIVSIPINKIIYNMTGLSNVIGESILIYLFMITISIIISLLSSYIPIRRISKMNIVDILRSE